MNIVFQYSTIETGGRGGGGCTVPVNGVLLPQFVYHSLCDLLHQ